MPMLTILRMRLPVCPFHSPLRIRSENAVHLVEHLVDAGNYVLTIDKDGFSLRRTQCHVQHRPFLGDVDLVPVKHRVHTLSQARLLGKLEQELASLLRDPVFE